MPPRSTKFPLVGFFSHASLSVHFWGHRWRVFHVYSEFSSNQYMPILGWLWRRKKIRKIARLSMWVNESIKSLNTFNIWKEKEFLDQTISYFYDCPSAHSNFLVPKWCIYDLQRDTFLSQAIFYRRLAVVATSCDVFHNPPLSRIVIMTKNTGIAEIL